MKNFIFNRIRIIAVLTVLLFTSTSSYASHILGMDLYYTWVSGNTYKITAILYGDCSPSSYTAFSTLPSSSPQICIYRGTTYVTTIGLTIQAPTSGTDITPVCPSEVGHTQCENSSSTIPGIKKFVYSANYTLPAPVTSNCWQFLYIGYDGYGSAAGRSANITNLVNPSLTSMELVDTLDNTVYAHNSNVQFSVVPTPFFCLNNPDSYNPGAVDPDLDAFQIDLISAMNSAYTSSGCSYGVPCSYTGTAWTPPTTPISPTDPLQVVAGSFSYNSSTGQLNFTPNAIQRATVVYNVREFRAGSYVGSCQREMNFLVLTCTHTNPVGAIDSASTLGTISSDSVHYTICDNTGPFSIYFNPTETGSTNDITVTSSGLPAGATLTVVGNGTTTPHATFTWTTTGIAPGTYIFYITYTDNNCPLAGTNTQAITIVVTPSPTITYTVISPATCVAKEAISIVPGGTGSPWNINVTGTTTQSFTGVTTTFIDSLPPGTDTISIASAAGSTCNAKFPITIAGPLNLTITYTNPTVCAPANGSFTLTGLTPGGSYNIYYTVGGTPYTLVMTANASGQITVTGLAAGTYTGVYATSTTTGCSSNVLTFTITSITITITGTSTNPTVCAPPNGTITLSGLSAGGSYTVYYTESGTPHSSVMTANASGQIIITGLPPGSYTGVYVVSVATGCTSNILTYTLVSTTLTITGTFTNPTVCTPPNGIITLSGLTAGGSYTVYYTEGGTPYSSTMTANTSGQIIITGLPPGSYTGVYVFSIATGCTSNILTFTLINPSDPPPPVLSSNAPICADSTLLLFATDGATSIIYSWTGPNGFTSTNINPSITTAQTIASGTYFVTVTSTISGCSSSSSMNITVKPTPAAPVVTGSNVCTGLTLSLGASSSAGCTYSWAGPSGFVSSIQNPTINPAAVSNTGTYTVVATLNGCPSLPGFGTYTVYPIPPPPAVSDTSYCQHAPVTLPLNATGTNLLWYTAFTGGTGSIATPVPADTAAGIYTWYVTQTINNCESPRKPVNITILNLPVFSIAGNTVLCLGATTTLSYSGSSLVSPSYTWSLPGDASVEGGSDTSNFIVVEFNASQTQSVLLTVSDYDGKCSTTESVPINAVAPPLSLFYVKPDICVGDTVVVALSYKSPSATVFAWNFDGANIIAANSDSGGPFSLSWNDTGIHILSLVTSTDIGCTTPPVYDTVKIHGLPNASIQPPTTNVACILDTALLSAVYDNSNYLYAWAPAHFFSYRLEPKSDNNSTVLGIIDYPGYVKLTITDPFGCMATDSLYLDPKPCCEVLFPNAFTPNGDTHNDVFRPIFKGYHKFHTFIIVNRWGQTVFETSNSDDSWDGNFNGVPQDIGVYYYYLKYDCGGGTLEAKGDVTLIR